MYNENYSYEYTVKVKSEVGLLLSLAIDQINPDFPMKIL
jgi:hypothetical protein